VKRIGLLAVLFSALAVVACGQRGESVSDRPPRPPEAPTTAVFADVTGPTGLDFVHFNGMTGERFIVEMMGPGGALLDFDNDGDLDLLLRQGETLEAGRAVAPAATVASRPPTDRFFRNDLVASADGSPAVRFVDVTARSGLALTGYGLGAATGDFDNDGFVDLYLTDFGPNRLLRNRGDGTFTDVTLARGTGDSRWTAAATFVDFDLDGWLDLFVGNYIDFSFANHQPCFRASSALDYCGPMSYRPLPDALWRNRGDGSFEEATAAVGMVGPLGSTLGVIALDTDGDGRPDLAVANDAMENFLWRNTGDGTFSEEGLLRGIAVNQAGQREGSMGITAGDFDHDGDEDLFVTHMATETNTLYVNQGDGLFLDRSLPAGLATPSRAATAFGTSWIDYDNDGWQDLMAVNGEVKVIEALDRAGDPFPLHQKNQLFRNLGDGTFREVSSAAGPAFEASDVSRGALFGDLDNDGDTDVVIANNNGPARVLANQVGSAASWLGLRAVMGAGPRTVSGTRLEIREPDGTVLLRTIRTDGSYLSAGDPRALFGLGARGRERDVRVEWPGGPSQRFRDLPPRHYLTLRGSARPRVGTR
jgi:hypothetical protein